MSGYFYHKRGAEKWCRVKSPTEADFRVVNGVIPKQLQPGESFAELLGRLNLEEGLLAELEFRQRHFESMRDWSPDGPDLMTKRYEDIVENEHGVFSELFSFYGLRGLRKTVALAFVDRYSSSGARAKTSHIRNPSSGQWREHLTPRVLQRIENLYGDVLSRYGYTL